MADKKSSLSSLLSPQTVLALLASVGVAGALIENSDLVSTRPNAPTLWSEPAKQGTVPTRLWEDPIKAVYSRLGDATADKAGMVVTMAPEVGPRPPVTVRNDELLLISVVLGDARPESENARLTTRYAVHAALSSVALVPESGTSIRCLGVPKDGAAGDGATWCSTHWAIPYETFVLDGPRPDAPQSYISDFSRVTVLWVRHDALPSGRGLSFLSSVISDAQQVFSDAGAPAPAKVAVLGPIYSDMLVDWLVEDALNPDPEKQPSDPRAALRGVKLQTTEATIGNERLAEQIRSALHRGDRTDAAVHQALERLELVGDKRRPPTEEGRVFALNCGATLTRTIASDDVLCRALAAELAVRGVPATDPSRGEQVDTPSHLAIVHEWDTVYGRSLPVSLKEIGGYDSRYFHEYTYLRGVDGFVPGQEDAQERAAARPDSRDSSRTAPGELAVGRSQFDYIRRMIEQIRIDRDQWWHTDRERLGAIGVLGTDTYDKLPLLKALRSAFPGVTIFTTDLNARVVQGPDAAALQNLIIASHFDLTLPLTFHQLTPPFRTGYQSSIAFATLHALGHPYCAPIMNAVRAGKAPCARLFELGLRGPVPLVDVLANGDFVPPREIEDVRQSALPEVPRFTLGTGAWHLGVGIASALFGFAVMAAIAWHGGREWRRTGGDAWRLKRPTSASDILAIIRIGLAVTGFISLAVISLLVASAISDRPYEEPLSFFQGISAWPSIFIRAFAVVLCILLWANLGRANQDNLIRLSGTPGLRLARIGRFRDSNDRDVRSLSNHVLAGAIIDFGHDVAYLIFGTPSPNLDAPRVPGGKLAVRQLVARAIRDGAIDYLFLAERMLRSVQRLCRIRSGRHSRIREASVFGWVGQRPGAEARAGTPASTRLDRLNPSLLWVDYLRLGRGENRAIRVLLAVAFHTMVVTGLIFIFGWPRSPARGHISHTLDLVFDFIPFVACTTLIFWVCDAVRLCARWVVNMASGDSDWPAGVIARVREREDLGVRGAEVLLDIQLIADRTDTVGRFILAPFFVLALLALASSRHLDNWEWNVALILGYSLSALILIYFAISLRAAAEKARTYEIQRLQAPFEDAESPPPVQPAPQIPDVVALPAPQSGALTVQAPPRTAPADLLTRPVVIVARPQRDTHDQIERAVARVREIRTGAFGGYRENPVIGALLLPFSGIGIVQLIDLGRVFLK